MQIIIDAIGKVATSSLPLLRRQKILRRARRVAAVFFFSRFPASRVRLAVYSHWYRASVP